MRKISFIFVIVLLMIAIGTAYAGGARNGTTVDFNQGGTYYCHTYWLKTGSGLLHEWRENPECAPYAGVYSLHLVFKPIQKFPAADCAVDGFLGQSGPWYYNPAYYEDLGGDDADIGDFIETGVGYWVCFYEW